MGVNIDKFIDFVRFYINNSNLIENNDKPTFEQLDVN